MIPDVCSAKEPPRKKTKFSDQEFNVKRTKSFKDEGPSKKKQKTFHLTDEEIAGLENKEIYQYLSDETLSDCHKLRILELSAKVDLDKMFFVCLAHCSTEKPVLFCLKKGIRSYEHMYELQCFLEHFYKPTFDYNKIYTFLKKKKVKAPTNEQLILIEACRRSLKDLCISCLKAKRNLFEKNSWGISAISQIFNSFSPEDLKEILFEAIQVKTGRRSYRLFEKNNVNWQQELGDTWEARAAHLFDISALSERKDIMLHMPQESFEKIYFAMFKKLPEGNEEAVKELNSLDRPKPPKNKVLNIVWNWAEEKEASPLMRLFEDLDVSSNMFLFWACFITKEEKETLSKICRLNKGQIWQRAMDCLDESFFCGSKFSNSEQLEFIACFLQRDTLPRITDINLALLNYVFKQLTNQNQCHIRCAFSWHDIYNQDDEKSKDEFWRNHPNDILLFLGVRTLEESEESFVDDKMFLRSLTSKDFVRMISLCHTDPYWLFYLIAENCHFDTLGLPSGGRCNNTWEYLLKCVLYKLGPLEIETPSPILTDLKGKLKDQKCQKEKCRITKVLPGSWLDGLKDEGWDRVKRYGRTELYKNRHDGTYRAIKFLKADEDPNDLYREFLITKCFHERGKEIGLKSQFPKVEDFVEFSGDMPDGFYEGWETELVFDKTPFHRNFAYIYSFPDDSYFRYLDEVEDDEAFDKSRNAVLHDLFLLINDNVLMTAIAGLFHNQGANRRYLCFPGLVFNDWRVGRTSGRIDKWEKAVTWSNERKSGLADTQEIEFLEDMASQNHPLTKQWFQTIFKKGDERPKPEVILLADFLAEYFLVDELILGKRAKQANRLDWKDSAKTDSLAEKLHEGAVIALEAATPFSKRISTKLVNGMSSRFDVYARQLAFWLQNNSKGYVPYVKKGEIPKELYPEGNVIVGSTDDMRNWKKDLGFSEDGINADLGSFNGVYPIKEGEMTRVFMVIMILVFRKAKEFEQKAKCDGLKALLNGDCQKAQAAFEEAISFNPYSKETWGLLSKVHQKLGNKELEEHCKKQRAALVIQNAYDDYKTNIKPTNRQTPHFL